MLVFTMAACVGLIPTVGMRIADWIIVRIAFEVVWGIES